MCRRSWTWCRPVKPAGTCLCSMRNARGLPEVNVTRAHTHLSLYQVVDVAELDLVSPSLLSASLACGALAASRPAHCAALQALTQERPSLAVADVPGLAGLERLHLGRRCEARHQPSCRAD